MTIDNRQQASTRKKRRYAVAYTIPERLLSQPIYCSHPSPSLQLQNSTHGIIGIIVTCSYIATICRHYCPALFPFQAPLRLLHNMNVSGAENAASFIHSYPDEISQHKIQWKTDVLGDPYLWWTATLLQMYTDYLDAVCPGHIISAILFWCYFMSALLKLLSPVRNQCINTIVHFSASESTPRQCVDNFSNRSQAFLWHVDRNAT
jgi:hypothetical protein